MRSPSVAREGEACGWVQPLKEAAARRRRRGGRGDAEESKAEAEGIKRGPEAKQGGAVYGPKSPNNTPPAVLLLFLFLTPQLSL
jgi:hypothetical protein